jgi:excisionase family DNA binding protein
VGTLRSDSSNGMTPPLLNWEGAAEFLGVTPRLVRELWARKELGGVRVGRRIRFREQDLAEYVERHRVGPVR